MPKPTIVEAGGLGAWGFGCSASRWYELSRAKVALKVGGGDELYRF